MQRDLELIDEYHKVDDGKYNGFGLGEHIGFTFWNDEDCKYPQQVYITPARSPRMIVVRCDKTKYLTGDTWRDMRPETWEDFLRPDVNEITFDIACASSQEIKYKIATEYNWMSFSCTEGTVSTSVKISLKIDRSKIDGDAEGDYSAKSAIGDRPYVSYNFVSTESTSYEMILYMSSTTPVCFETKQFIGYSINDEPLQIVNTVHQPEKPFFLSRQWEDEAISNIKVIKVKVDLKIGLNTLKLCAVSPQIKLRNTTFQKINK